MARRRATRRRAPSQNSLSVSRRIEVGADGNDYEVRPVPGARATKVYRCPGCDHEIRPGTAHLVVWPAGSSLASVAVEERRHWHTACWANRTTRSPTRRWS
ncbi:MAG: hypothetical protein ACXWZL_10330 [Mycobacterium sp.]